MFRKNIIMFLLFTFSYSFSDIPIPDGAMKCDDYGRCVLINSKPKKHKYSALDILKAVANAGFFINTFTCDVFGCKVKEDSSLYIIGENKHFKNEEYTYDNSGKLVFISLYNKEYILARRDNHSIGEKDKSLHISNIMPHCEINFDNYHKSKKSKCDLEPIIIKFPKEKSICFIDEKNIYTLKKENHITDIVLKLESEIINNDYLEQLEEDYNECIFEMYLLKEKYGYDFVYTTSKAEICNLNAWKGVRLEKQPKETQELLDYLFSIPEDCFNIDATFKSQFELPYPTP